MGDVTEHRDADAIGRALDNVFDHAVVHHGYVDYMRDYEMIVYTHADPSTGIAPAHVRFVFAYCVRASVESTVPPDGWAQSLDERLIDYATGSDLDGYVWGVKWHVLYPGARVEPRSEEADRWAAAVGIPFHEVTVETNAHHIVLVFSTLRVDTVATGYAPFVVTSD